MENVIIIIALLIIVGGGAFYVIRAKKRGEKCIGCPYSKECKGGCHCGGQNEGKKN
jgi:hypothetical protein